MKPNRETLFTVVLLVLVGAAVLQARDWQFKASLFPMIIGGPLLGLLILQILLSMRRSGAANALETAHAEGAMAPDERRRIYSIVGWLAAFALLIWLIGFPFGGTLGTLLYLHFTAREKWRVILGLTVGTAIFFYVTAQYLSVPYPRGLLVELISPVQG